MGDDDRDEQRAGAVQSAESAAKPSRAEQTRRGERPARRVRQRGERAAQRGERGELGKRLVRMHDQPDRAEQHEHGRRAVHAAILLRACPVARREVDEPERGSIARAREARGGMKLHDAPEQQAEAGGEPVVERRIEQPRRAGDAGNERRAAARPCRARCRARWRRASSTSRVRRGRKRERQRDQRERGGRGGRGEARIIPQKDRLGLLPVFFV